MELSAIIIPRPEVAFANRPHRVTATVVDTALPRTLDGRVAYVVSQVGSPPVLTLAALAAHAALSATARTWALAGVYALLAVIAPLGHLVWLLRRGRVTDLDVQRREQRIRPMLFTLACGALAWVVLALAAAPARLLALTGALWLQMGIVFVITFRWKISVHCASAATLAALTGFLAGTPLPLLIGLPLIAWSRVRLRRHTLAQAIAGACLGCAVALLALTLLKKGG